MCKCKNEKNNINNRKYRKCLYDKETKIGNKTQVTIEQLGDIRRIDEYLIILQCFKRINVQKE